MWSEQTLLSEGEGLREEGGIFIRRRTSSVTAHQDMIMKMMRDESPVRYGSLPSRIQDLTLKATSRVFEDNRVPFEDRQMDSLRMGSGRVYTNLGFMLSYQLTRG